MKLTCISPCYNEIRFVRAWLENCLAWADRVIVSEGGSTDGTRQVLAGYERQFPGWLTVLDRQQSDSPTEKGYGEGVRRHELTDLVTDGHVVLCDADEMMEDNFRIILHEKLIDGHAGATHLHHFWRSPLYVRVGTEPDPHWGPIYKVTVVPAGALKWDTHPSSAAFYHGLPVVELPARKYHYHYLFGRRKDFENRHAEIEGKLLVEHVPLKQVLFKHPKAFGLLEEHVRFADLLPREYRP